MRLNLLRLSLLVLPIFLLGLKTPAANGFPGYSDLDGRYLNLQDGSGQGHSNPLGKVSLPSSPSLGIGGMLNSGDNTPALPDQSPVFEAIEDSAYFIGPGDFLLIGNGSKSIYAAVNPEGYITIESSTPVHVDGLTLAQAKSAIIEKVSKFYKTERIFVTLAKAKRFQVMITGTVINPGIYVLAPTSRLDDLIQLAGGFSVLATRSLTLTSKSGEKRDIDIEAYFLRQEMQHNPYLTQGDKIESHALDFEKPFVYVREENSMRPLQLKEGESLLPVLSRYFNFKNKAEWDYVHVFAGGKLIDKVTRQDAPAFIPKNGNILEVHTVKPAIFVSGGVAKPGMFDFNVNFTALDYIALAGITPTTGNISDVEVLDSEGQKRRINSSKDKLYAGDHLLIPQSRESKFRDYLGLILSMASLAVAVATFVTLSNN